MTEQELNKQIKKIGIRMMLLMGITLSFFLSLTGLLLSGHFTWKGLLINWLISFVISCIIGRIYPMHKISVFLDKKFGLKHGKLSTHLVESFLSDCAYTPIITFVMVFIAWKQAVAQGASISLGAMFGASLLVSLVAGYVLIVIFIPIFIRITGASKLGKPEEIEKTQE
ncbi:hypothetical protein SAMN04487977_101383 [Treponema bryantii]|uniref:Uncharacterized protein n=1 Tax=Treponema bryantii TaxID=163 RepID=A0A1H9AMG0_9SPIR|nr:hypothetical protein [Treponema bryantii]SEP77573.1 hypothetical protein SAMN04487977_101383 [Treponema bryantii]